MENKKKQHQKLAPLCSIIPGGGQFYNGQRLKGVLYFVLVTAYVLATFQTVIYGNKGGGVSGLFTLGTEKGEDNSLFFLVEGTYSLFLAAVGLVIYIVNIVDARRVGRRIDEGKEVRGLRAGIRAAADKGFPYLIMFPGIVLMILAVVFPIVITIMFSFTNYNVNHLPPKNLFAWIGLGNYIEMFTAKQWRNTFVYTLGWTLLWTLCATTLTIVMGILTAVVINQKEVKLKKLWRTVYILPWAIPAFVSVLMFSVFFNDSFGAMNTQVIPFLDKLLPFLRLSTLPWKSQVFYCRLALILVQGWLGFPYIMVMTTGVLQSIPGDLYEAAQVDGATRFQQFKKITLPWILSSIAPVLITQYTFNFNNFNIIYLFSSGGPAVSGQLAGGTDILVSWVYKITTESVARDYGVAAAITVFISLFVMAVALSQYIRTDSFKGGKGE